MDARRRPAVALCLAGLLFTLGASPLRADMSSGAVRGEQLYRHGMLPSGGPLQAARDAASLDGRAAACVNCHRRSGLGSYEGSVLVPPITGPYLFRDRKTNIEDLTLPHVPGYSPNEVPYTVETLAQALRTGVAADGRRLSSLMPRYELDEPSLRDLVEYLRTLSAGPMPGVGDETLDFATIVTPDADPARVEAMLGVLDTYFKLRNAALAPRVQRARASAVEYRASRYWRLHVWRLSGAPPEWQSQLHALQSSQPAFAVISGVGKAVWEPVHSFCEADRVPCLFPNVELPVVAEEDFYPLYFSRGVLLEAELIAADLATRELKPGSRLVQVYRADDVGARAAAALEKEALAMRIKVALRPLKSMRDLPGILSAIRSDDAVVLWLRPADLATLGSVAPAGAVYLSGLMASLESAPLPPAWRRTARLAYPVDLPESRRVRMNFPHAWFQSHGIRVTDDVLQTDTYVACMVLADTIDSMLDAFVPEFLIERVENMLSQRAANGYFPRLSVAPGQRFASKGGYVVQFAESSGTAVRPLGPWIIPSFD